MHTAGMRCARVALAALVVAPALVVLSPGVALACSCAEASTAELVGYVDTVAVGQLTAVEPPPPAAPDGMTDSGALMTYTATLQTVLKGEPDNPLVFRSASDGGACGLEGMAVGREYVFFVRGRQAGLCDGTAPVSPALVADVEAVTGPGKAAPASTPELTTEPDQGLEVARESGTLTAAPWGAVAAGAVALLVVGWLSRGRWSGPRSGGN